MLCVTTDNPSSLFICSQHEKQNSSRQNWVQERKLWEDDVTVSDAQVSDKCIS